jgi:excisionase family DNA binding protein
VSGQPVCAVPSQHSDVFATIDEAADYFGVTGDAVRAAIARGELAAIQLGGCIRIRWQAIYQQAGESTSVVAWPVGVGTPHEAATLLKLNPETVRRFVADGILPGFKIGRATRIRWSRLNDFLAGLEATAAESRDPASEQKKPHNASRKMGG